VLSDFKFRHYLPPFTQRSKECASLIRVIPVTYVRGIRDERCFPFQSCASISTGTAERHGSLLLLVPSTLAKECMTGIMMGLPVFHDIARSRCRSGDSEVVMWITVSATQGGVRGDGTRKVAKCVAYSTCECTG
jgi:hypothetical protein